MAREAFLTGTDAEIEAAPEALVADRSADADAREAAKDYLEADGDWRDMYETLVQTYCQP